MDAIKNFSYGTVLTAPSPATTGTSLVLNSGEGALFPDPSTDGEYNIIVWPINSNPLASNAEICRVTAISTDTLTITREQEGTTARTIVEGDQVMLGLTAKVLDDIESFLISEGVLFNGKIVPSVASNDLTVAIKTLAGADPSITDPVKIRINGTVHTITSALSVTKNAGTNWFNSGGSELATLEVDYFVYLGYNATDGVVIGFARVPYASLYSEFSTTTTSEKYCAISTITNAVSGDDYVNIGRFAATLSAGAGYTWTVPTFTTRNLIQRPILVSRLLSWVPTVTFTGGSAPTGGAERKSYWVIGPAVYYTYWHNYGVAGSTITAVDITLPFGMASPYTYQYTPVAAMANAGTTPYLKYANLAATGGANNGSVYISITSCSLTEMGSSGSYGLQY